MQDLDKLGVDWNAANRHRLALKLGRPKETSDLCPCCYNPIQKDAYSLCENTKQMEIFGFGLPIMYSFLRNSIILLMVTSCSYNVLSLFLAIQENYAWCQGQKSEYHTAQCQSSFVLLARVSSQITFEETILRIVSFVIHLLTLVYIRDKLVKMHLYLDQRNCSMSDYALLISNIPMQIHTREKLRNFFENAYSEPIHATDIILLPEYEQIKQVRSQKKKIIDKLRPYYKNPAQKNQQKNQQKNHLQQELQQINKDLREEIQQYKKSSLEDKVPCHNAIMIVNTAHEKKECIDEFEKIKGTRKHEYFGKSYEKMVIEEAPEPQAIIWENIGMNVNIRRLLVIGSFLISALILAVITGIFYVLMEVKSQIFQKDVEIYKREHDSSRLVQGIVLVYAMLFGVVFFNKFIMSLVFHKLTHHEEHFREADLQLSFGIKYCLGLFFTTALMTIAIEALRHHDYYTLPYGVVDEQSVMFFFNAFVVPTLWFINPFQLSKQCKRPQGQPQHYTQRQANYLMEDYPYDIGKRFAETIETLWFTYLYATLIPMGSIISAVGLGYYYWVDKYNLLRVHSMQTHISGNYLSMILKFLDLTLLLKVLGALLFDYQLRNQVHISTIIMGIIAFVYLLLPIDSMIECVNKQNFHLQENQYQHVLQRFRHRYRDLHPVYSV